jgi:superfamily II DNA/RNA helicase
VKKFKHCYVVCNGEEDRFKVCARYYGTVIFCNTREKVVSLTQRLAGYNKDRKYRMIHEGLPHDVIEDTIQQFYSGLGYVVLVASEVLSSRIDMKIVGRIINHDLPATLHYTHSVARKYNNGFPPLTVNLVAQQEVEAIRRIERHHNIHIQHIPLDDDINKTLRAIQNYSYNTK